MNWAANSTEGKKWIEKSLSKRITSFPEDIRELLLGSSECVWLQGTGNSVNMANKINCLREKPTWSLDSLPGNTWGALRADKEPWLTGTDVPVLGQGPLVPSAPGTCNSLLDSVYGDFKIAKATLRFWSSSLQSLDMRKENATSEGLAGSVMKATWACDDKQGWELVFLVHLSHLILTVTLVLSADKEMQLPRLKCRLNLKQVVTPLWASVSPLRRGEAEEQCAVKVEWFLPR